MSGPRRGPAPPGGDGAGDEIRRAANDSPQTISDPSDTHEQATLDDAIPPMPYTATDAMWHEYEGLLYIAQRRPSDADTAIALGRLALAEVALRQAGRSASETRRGDLVTARRLLAVTYRRLRRYAEVRL